MKKKKSFLYKIEKDKLKDRLMIIRDGGVPLDSRYQVKLPTFLVEEISNIFPDLSRSDVLTKATADYLLRAVDYMDENDDMAVWKAGEQQELDEMWDKLKEIDGEYYMPIEEWVDFNPKEYEKKDTL